MEQYKKQFAKEIRLYSLIALILIFIANCTELIFNYSLYASWINLLTISTSVINLALILLSIFGKIESTRAFVILAYIFTLNIYLPAYTDNLELKQFAILAFTNLGACYAVIIFTGLIGSRINAVVLGVLNVLIIGGIFLSDYKSLQLDFINIFIFGATTIALSSILKSLEKTLKEHESRKKQLRDYEKQMARLLWEEEQKRVSFLSAITEENTKFLRKLSLNLSTVLSEKEDSRKVEILHEQIRECKNQQNFTSQLEFSKLIKDVESEFYLRLKNKYSDLTGIEQQMCSLIRYNLTTSELATQLNKSVETVKWYRKRIRKKLKLSTEVNLKDFCNQI